MQADQDQPNKKKTRIVIAASIGVFAIVAVLAMFVLSKLNELRASEPNNQEQFAGQAQSSEQLQAECQNSAKILSNEEDVTRSFNEFRKNAEACLEVYVTVENESKRFRSEGMYADLSADLIKAAVKSDKKLAFEILAFAKQLPAWEFYNGPVVCSSARVLEAYEESLKTADDKVCIKPEEYKTRLVPELKAKNFDFLLKLVPHAEVVWLGTPESDSGCPKKLDEIIKIVAGSAGSSTELREEERANEMNQMSAVFGDKTNNDKVILQFSSGTDSCIRFDSVLIQNLQTNE